MTEQKNKPAPAVQTYWRIALFVIALTLAGGVLIAFPHLLSSGESGKPVDSTSSKTQAESSSQGDNSPGSAGYR